MKRICRILSLIVSLICLIVTVMIVVKVVNKPKSKTIYATDINFVTPSGGVIMYKNNELVVSKSMVNILPKHCKLEPEFQIKKHGEEEIKNITSSSYKFTEEGKYTLICKIQGGKDYYIDDKLTITVVDVPDESADVYIKKLNFDSLMVGDCADLNNMFKLVPSTNNNLRVETSEHLRYENGKIYVEDGGYAWINIFVTSEGFTIRKTISLNILSKPESSEGMLKITIGNTVLDRNEIEIEYSEFNFVINYELVGMSNQYIACWTDGDVVEVISFNPPTIIIKPLKTGATTIYVSPLEHPSIALEIVVTII